MQLGEWAFDSNQLTEVTINNRATVIGENAFANNQTISADLTICGYEGSTAENYAMVNNHTFEAIPESWNPLAMGCEGLSEGNAYNVSLTVYQGTPYAAYGEQTYSSGTKANVKKFNGTALEFAGNPNFSDGPARDISLVVYEGTPYVAYRDGSKNEKVIVKKYDGSSWEDVGSPGFSEGSISLAVYQGIPYLAYRDYHIDNKAMVMKYSSDEPPTTYKVKYDGNGNTGGSAPNVDCTYSDGVAVTVLGNTGYLTRTGYTFDGWNTESDGAGTDYSEGESLTINSSDVTLYAKWKLNATYTVTYNGNGNTGGAAPMDSSSYEQDTTVTILGNTGSLAKTGYTFEGWNTAADGKGTDYKAGDTLAMGNSNITLYAKWTAAGGNKDGNGGGSGGNSSAPAQEPAPENGNTDISVNGQTQGNAATSKTVKSPNGQTTTTVTLDGKKLEEILKKLPDADTNSGSFENRQVITIPIAEKSDIAVGELTGQMVKDVEFNITCTYGDKTFEVSQFNSYVERTVAIPDGVDPSKITTGIVVEPDGTVRHVPTKIIVIDGKYYAKINSLTNSTYSVVWHLLEFKDTASHWAKEAINDMGSRMVISGVGNDIFDPDRNITRAEFAAIIIRALGLKPGNGKIPFTDVKGVDWYSSCVVTAAEYKIVSGYGDGKFGPNDKITREQAMTMIARAMRITGLKSEIKDSEISSLFANYSDATAVSDYAKTSMAACLKTGIITGRSNNTISPKNCITRAEVAVIVQRLLQKSNLI